MKTTKEVMSGYLERLQHLQRLALGAENASFSIEPHTADYGFCIWVNLHVWSPELDSQSYNIKDWCQKEENDQVMREIKEYMLSLNMIEP